MYLFLIGVLNGIVTGLVYSTEQLWWCIFFCMVPFVGILLSGRRTLAFMMGYGMGYHVTGLAFLFQLAGMLPLPPYTAHALMAAGVFLAGLVLSMVFSLVFYPFLRRRRRSGTDIFLVAGLYILAEWLQGMLPLFAFPWFRLATVVAERPFLLQGASLLGTLFVDFLIVLWNGFLAGLIGSRRVGAASWTALVLIAGVLMYGEVRLYEGEESGSSAASIPGAEVQEQQGSRHRMMLVQGNHEGRKKWKMEIRDIVSDYMAELDREIEEGISLVVLPETALPYAIRQDGETENLLRQFCSRHHTEMLTGAIEKGTEEESYNAVCHVTSEGIGTLSYRKQILVPFGEYLPFAAAAEKLCPWLMEFMTGNVFEAGTETVIFDTGAGKAGTLVCFESLFPEAAERTVEAGAQLLVIVSNDAWFEGTSAMRKHHAHAVLRAVETDRWVFRAANTGISSVIDNRGRIQAVLRENTRGVLKGEVDCRTERTFYNRIGDVLPAGFLAWDGILLFSCFSAIIRRWNYNMKKMRRS